MVWIDEAGKEAIFDASGAPRPAIAALLTSGDTVLSVDVFMTGEFLKAPNASLRNRMVDGPPVAAFTYGYNPPLFVERVHDVIAALRYARSRAHSEVRLVGLGRGAGAWAAHGERHGALACRSRRDRHRRLPLRERRDPG